jgi:translation initiation factor 1
MGKGCVFLFLKRFDGGIKKSFEFTPSRRR